MADFSLAETVLWVTVRLPMAVVSTGDKLALSKLLLRLDLISAFLISVEMHSCVRFLIDELTSGSSGIVRFVSFRLGGLLVLLVSRPADYY